MALIRICDSYNLTGVPAGVAFKAMKADEIPHTGQDRGGLTLVNDTDLIALPRLAPAR